MHLLVGTRRQSDILDALDDGSGSVTYLDLSAAETQPESEEDLRRYVKTRIRKSQKQTNRRFNRLEDRTETLEKRLDGIDAERRMTEWRIHSDTERMLDGLLQEARDHAERRALEDSQRTLVEQLDVPSYELPRLAGGVDLGGLYELAAELKKQGMA